MLYTFLKHLMVNSRFASAIFWQPFSVETHLIPNQNGRQTTRNHKVFFGGVKEAPLWIYLFKKQLRTLNAFVHEQHKLRSVVSGLLI